MKTKRRILLLGLLITMTTGAWADKVIESGGITYINSDLSGYLDAVTTFLPENTDNRSKLAAFSNRLKVNSNLENCLDLYFLCGKEYETNKSHLTYTLTAGEYVEAVTMEDAFPLQNYNGMRLPYPKQDGTMSYTYMFDGGNIIDFHLTVKGQIMADSPSHHVIAFKNDNSTSYSDVIFVACDDDGNWDYRDRVFVIDPNMKYNISIVAPTTASLSLEDDDTNSEIKNSKKIYDASGSKYNVTLNGRTLYRDGNWNTLCLPFNLSAQELASNNCPLKGATIMTLMDGSTANPSTAFDPNTGKLTINFSSANSIDAGRAYLVKWNSGSKITNPTFWDVTVSTITAKANPQYVEFIGITSPLKIYDEQKTKLYLGEGNTLYYPTDPNFTVNSCRGYFQLKDGLTAGSPSSSGVTSVRAFSLDFGDGTTGITTTNFTNDTNSSEEWYTIDGRKVNSKSVNSQLPKGLYIHQGKKIIIK